MTNSCFDMFIFEYVKREDSAYARLGLWRPRTSVKDVLQ